MNVCIVWSIDKLVSSLNIGDHSLKIDVVVDKVKVDSSFVAYITNDTILL